MVLKNFLKIHLKKERNRIGFYIELYINFKSVIDGKKIVVAECSVKVNKLNIMLHLIKF